jgi:predicted PurR-regulated permease PerM
MLKKYPFYFKSTVILFGLVLLVYALFALKDIFVPLVFALLLALLLNPLQNWFPAKGFQSFGLSCLAY